MASGFTTTHACHCWSQTYKSLKRKVSRPDGVLEEAQASTGPVGSFDKNSSCSALHLFTFAWSQQGLMATRALATGSCRDWPRGCALTLPQRWKSGVGADSVEEAFCSPVVTGKLITEEETTSL